VRILGLLVGALIGLAVFAQPSSAQQNLDYAVFERTLDALRTEAGIPAISAAIVENGTIWTRGLGFQDLEGRIQARADTPYPIGA